MAVSSIRQALAMIMTFPSGLEALFGDQRVLIRSIGITAAPPGRQAVEVLRMPGFAPEVIGRPTDFPP